jgi:Papain family cysteine protease
MINIAIDISKGLGPIRDQGARPTCLAFAGSDLHSYAHKCVHLSVDYLSHHTALAMSGIWQPGMGFSVDHLLQAVNKPGQPEESIYPYHPTDQNRPLMAPPVASGLRKMAARHPVLGLSDIAPNIQQGHPVGVVIAVTPSLQKPINGVVEYQTGVIADQYHALSVVGLGKSDHDGHPHYLVRNSWGPSWGKGGHAWIPERHLSRHTVRAFII